MFNFSYQHHIMYLLVDVCHINRVSSDARKKEQNQLA